ncbi:unnamed protein product [Bubo scandiacus]
MLRLGRQEALRPGQVDGGAGAAGAAVGTGSRVLLLRRSGDIAMLKDHPKVRGYWQLAALSSAKIYYCALGNPHLICRQMFDKF